MQIIKYIDLFIGALISMITCSATVKILFKEKFNKKILNLILILFFTSLILCIINIFNKSVFKILLTLPFVITGNKYLFEISYKKSIFYTIIATIYMFIAEILVGIFLSILPIDYTFIFNNILGSTIGNLFVTAFTLILLLSKKTNQKIINFLKKSYEKDDNIILIFIVVAIGVLAYKNVNSTENIINVIMNIIATIIFVCILYIYFKENIKSLELSKKYNELFEYLEKYEKELVEKRKIIHDYKNQLIIINGYIGNNKKLKEYVGELINEQKMISENSLISNIDKLPRGLKGLIYYKLSHINKNIKIKLDVLNSLKRFDKMPPKLNKEVLKMIGILIDNAIEATENEKEKFINIEFSIKNSKFIMNMENPCSSNINYQEMSKVGFSTKGKNRGYGIPLINDILKKQKDIVLNINIENNEFITKLEVKI